MLEQFYYQNHEDIEREIMNAKNESETSANIYEMYSLLLIFAISILILLM